MKRANGPESREQVSERILEAWEHEDGAIWVPVSLREADRENRHKWHKVEFVPKTELDEARAALWELAEAHRDFGDHPARFFKALERARALSQPSEEDR